MSSLLSRLVSRIVSDAPKSSRRPQRRRPAVRPSVRPRLELLEDRLAPATLTALAPCAGGPLGGMVMDSHGNLYGTTEAGGTYNDGTVFELASGSHTITTLASFNGANGLEPSGDLVMDSQGNLYGTTYAGGTSPNHGVGTVFELPNGSNTITDLVTFYQDNPDPNGTEFPLGASPLGGLSEDSHGNLFGTTSVGGLAGRNRDGSPITGEGTAFEITSGTHAFRQLAVFSPVDLSRGMRPADPPIEDSNGNLFGMTTEGGDGFLGHGVVYEVSASGSLTTLATFNGANGANGGGALAIGRLIMDGHGNLFGTTQFGGPTWTGSDDSGYGTVFEIASGSHTITTVASFDAAHDIAHGYYPAGGLVEDGHGNLFGTTIGGGAYGYGTVFEIASGSHTVTTLGSFKGVHDGINDGSGPVGDMIMDGNGNLFGVASGRNGNSPAVFEVATGISPFGGVTVQAPDVTSSNAAQQNPYTFSVAFHDETLVNSQSVPAATVLVQPPTGPALTAHLAGIVASNPNASGNSANLTAVYQITPPGGSWAGAPAGTYSVVLSGSPVTDLAGFAAPLGTVGTFNVASIPSQDATATTLTASAATPLAGADAVTFTATVTDQGSGGGTPAGAVDFYDTTAGQELGSAALVNGVATLTAGPFAAGGHTITATYGGDGDFLPSSNTTSLTALTAVLSASSAQTVRALQNVATGSVLLATFSVQTGLPLNPSDFGVVIDWQDGGGPDGTRASVTVSGTQVQVYGTHTYTAAGSYTPAVTLSYAGGTSAVANPTVHVATDVTSSVSMTRSAPTLYAGATNAALGYYHGDYRSTLTVKNTGSSAVTGSLEILLSGLAANSPGVTLQYATATVGGTLYHLEIDLDSANDPYVDIPQAVLASLAPGGSLTVSLWFSEPTPTFITYTPKLFSDPWDN